MIQTHIVECQAFGSRHDRRAGILTSHPRTTHGGQGNNLSTVNIRHSLPYPIHYYLLDFFGNLHDDRTRTTHSGQGNNLSTVNIRHSLPYPIHYYLLDFFGNLHDDRTRTTHSGQGNDNNAS